MKIDRFIIPTNIEKTKFNLVREIEIKESKSKLVRENDGLTKHASRIKWMEWNEDGTLKAHHTTCSPFSVSLLSKVKACFS